MSDIQNFRKAKQNDIPGREAQNLQDTNKNEQLPKVE